MSKIRPATTLGPKKTPTTQLERSAAQRLRSTMAAVRLSFTWLGVRKTLAPEQRTTAARASHTDRERAYSRVSDLTAGSIRTQNPRPARACGFKSLLRHLVSRRKKAGCGLGGGGEGITQASWHQPPAAPAGLRWGRSVNRSHACEPARGRSCRGRERCRV